jgi:transposase
VHSRYWRRACDLPVSGVRVVLQVQARRFFCDVGGCRRRVYCERFPGVLEPYSRWTERARKALLEMSHASSAESVARIARMMGFKVSHDSLLRLQGREVFSFRHAPYIAVDEYAWRKRQRYGTLIVDLERRLPVALLPTDTAEGLSAWLRLNGPIAVTARDRDHTFANAAKLDAPGGGPGRRPVPPGQQRDGVLPQGDPCQALGEPAGRSGPST